MPDLVEHTSTVPVARCKPAGFYKLLRIRLKYIPKWKEDPETSIQIMTEASTEWELVEMKLRDRAKKGEASTPKGSSIEVQKIGDSSK